MTSEELHELPRRAQVGYILKHATVHQGGAWTPSMVFWILERTGCVDYDDFEAEIELIEDVMSHNSGVDYDGS